MPPQRSFPRATAYATVLAVLLCVLGPAGPARAETAAEARAAAVAAAAEIAALQPQLAAAAAAVDAALLTLTTSATRSLGSEDIADAAARTHASARRTHVARVRAVYMSGGQAVLYTGLLDSGSPHELLARMTSVRRVVAAGGDAAEGTGTAARAFAREASRQGLTAMEAVVTVRDVEALQLRVDALLTAATQRLEALSATARSLEEAEAAAAALEAARAAAVAAAAARAAGARVNPAPAEYAALYHAAALTCPGLPWSVLSAIGQVETGHGRNTNTSSAGARGPMQFMPATFALYGVDGGGDGVVDILDPADSVFSAARYLCASGAGVPAQLPRAIWHYNHAQWYVDMVLRIAAQIEAAATP